MGAVGNVLADNVIRRAFSTRGRREGAAPGHRHGGVRRRHRPARTRSHATDQARTRQRWNRSGSTSPEGVRVPRPQRQRADGPLRGPPPARRGAGRRPARAAVPGGEGRPDVPDRHRGRRGRHGPRGGRARSASRRPAWWCCDKHLNHFNVHALEDAADGGAVAQRPAGAGRADAARHPGHDLDRPAARVHRERRRLLHGQGVLAVARAARAWPRCATPTLVRAFRRHRPAGVRRGGHPGRAAPDARPRHRAAVGAAGGHVRAGPRPRHRAGRGLPQGFPAGRARTGQRRLHEQALPRRRPAEGRRGRALPLRPRAGLPRRAVRRPPQAVPADHRGRHRRDHAVLRHAGRARDRRREDRGGRLRLQPPGRHGPAARAARLRRRRRHRLGARQRQPRRRPGAAGARLGRRAPRPARADGADPRRRRRPVRRRGVRRHPARPGRGRAGSARSASTSRRGGCWP